MLGRLAGLQRQVAWQGGLANHQDAFAPLAHMLLVLHCAAAMDLAPGQLVPLPGGSGQSGACVEVAPGGGRDGAALGSAAEAVQRCVWGFLAVPLQPLLGNMLVQVRGTHLLDACLRNP